jgi:hypothetical protein
MCGGKQSTTPAEMVILLMQKRPGTRPRRTIIAENDLQKRLLQSMGVMIAVMAVLAALFANAQQQLSKLRPGYLEAHAAALNLKNLLGNPDFSSTGNQQTTMPALWNLHLVDSDAGKKVDVEITPAAAADDCAVATITNNSDKNVIFYTDIPLDAKSGRSFSFSAYLSVNHLPHNSLQVGTFAPQPQWFVSSLVDRKRPWQLAQLAGHLPEKATGARAHIYVSAKSQMKLKCPEFGVF